VDQVLTGTVHGNTIVLDHPLPVPDGQAVEVVVRDCRSTPVVPAPPSGASHAPPTWWTADDDRILAEIHETRKQSARPEALE
jgi:hypothetical protein